MAEIEGGAQRKQEAFWTQIARFIASVNPDIHYSLLAFYPHFYMGDLPSTSRSHAFSCKEAAERGGLNSIRLGNVHLLGRD